MKTVVMIPTYNEAGSIDSLISELLALPLDNCEILVVDDNSPDGTGEIVKKIAVRDHRVHLISRPGPRGRGWAGREGFLRALDLGADCIVEMDGDGSHNPAELPRLLEPIIRDEADLVIGSRFIPGGAVEGRQWFRDCISGWARSYIRTILGIAVNDPTSGYRVFRRKALEALKPETLRASDPFIVTEVLYRCHRAGLRIVELPIVFRRRERDVSKLNSLVLITYLFRVWKLKFT
ncbi:MAG: polyprenol monophosphomannose synthase [Candidatus Euphemobacter frigidus]|nr:polyprenol monophosphomannose synthase [Candidatus Euphemobacter frigidus]MDP8276700.1 polyprenol monophosphomannose synthase [Candidatus Euphemobacter frigidus]